MTRPLAATLRSMFRVGRSRSPSRRPAHLRLGVAVTRGLLLDLLATGDVEAADQAMDAYLALTERWLETNAGLFGLPADPDGVPARRRQPGGRRDEERVPDSGRANEGAADGVPGGAPGQSAAHKQGVRPGERPRLSDVIEQRGRGDSLGRSRRPADRQH